MAQTQRRWLVSGRVQGVSFRWFTREAARRLDVVGSVRNLPDGRVEVHAAGDPERLESLLEQLHQGPPASSVTAVSEAALDPDSRIKLEQARSFDVTFWKGA